jgi:hypothetical protein
MEAGLAAAGCGGGEESWAEDFAGLAQLASTNANSAMKKKSFIEHAS